MINNTSTNFRIIDDSPQQIQTQKTLSLRRQQPNEPNEVADTAAQQQRVREIRERVIRENKSAYLSGTSTVHPHPCLRVKQAEEDLQVLKANLQQAEANVQDEVDGAVGGYYDGRSSRRKSLLTGLTPKELAELPSKLEINCRSERLSQPTLSSRSRSSDRTPV